DLRSLLGNAGLELINLLRRVVALVFTGCFNRAVKVRFELVFRAIGIFGPVVIRVLLLVLALGGLRLAQELRQALNRNVELGEIGTVTARGAGKLVVDNQAQRRN